MCKHDVAWKIWAVVSHDFVRTDRSVQKSVRSDKNVYIDRFNATAEIAAINGDHKKIYNAAKLASGKTRTPFAKVVRWEDGSPTTSPAEYARCFTEHFRGVFGASVLKVHGDLEPSIVGTPKTAPRVPDIDDIMQRDVPTDKRVHTAILKLKGGKAVGFDGIEAEVLKAGGARSQ